MAGFLQNSSGFLAPTGFINGYPRQQAPINPSIGVGGSGGIRLPQRFTRVAGYTGGMGVGNAPGLTTQEQYGGPLMNALQDLVRGVNLPTGGSIFSAPQKTQPTSNVPITQPDSIQGVK